MIMKKGFFILCYSILFSMFIVLFISSCNSFESDAHKTMRKTLYELAKNPDTYKISNEEVVVSNDSLVIIHCIGKGQNGFGGWSSSNIEYVYILTKKHNHIYEYVNTDGSIYSTAKFALNKKEITDDEIYGFANVYAVLNGRRVK